MMIKILKYRFILELLQLKYMYLVTLLQTQFNLV